MKIVIDLQGVQASNRKRGIGRYCLSLALALVRQRGQHEVIIALSGMFPETIIPIREAFEGLLDSANIRVWHAPGPVNPFDPDDDSRRLVAELIRESFMANLSPDVVVIGSLFEGGDNAVTSIGSLPSSIKTAVVLYDLIPLINSEIYLKNPVIDRWYKNKIEHLRRADLLLSISASSGREAVDHLGIDSSKVHNISTAADMVFRPVCINDDTRRELRRKYGLIRPYILYTGGIDHRKNIEGLISAYAQLPADIRSEHQLAVVCFVQDAERDRLLKIAADAGLSDGELILTGFVSDQDLLLCYCASKLFVFPSWHEGFGLPALEAMQCGKAVIASNTSSLPEVIGRSDALFNPFDSTSIAQKILQVLQDDDFREELESHGLVQAAKFNWEGTAIKAWHAMEASAHMATKSPTSVVEKPRLAYFSPLPPEASGISDYSAELLPELARYYQVEVIISQDHVSDAWVNTNCNIRNIDWFRRHALEFERVLYHFGNSNFHDHMFPLLAEYPGVIVLHDFFLSGAISWREITGEIPHYWTQTLLESHGWMAVEHRCKRSDTPNIVYEYPCNSKVLQEALGIIVHADYPVQLAREWYGEQAGAKFRKIPLLRKPAPKKDVAAARSLLDIDIDEFIVCSFGLLGAPKLNHRLLNAWLQSPFTKDPKCRLVFVGKQSGDYGAELERVIREENEGRLIEITGWVDDKTYRNWLAAADVGVQLRSLSRGETSAAVLDCMNYGLPTVVNANGSMSELDIDAVSMIPDEFSDFQLVQALTELWENKQLRADLSVRARQVILNKHDPSACAELYVNVIEDFYSQTKNGISDLLNAVSKDAARLEDADLQNLAGCIDKNNPPPSYFRQFLVDITDVVNVKGEQERASDIPLVLLKWLRSVKSNWRVELIYHSADGGNYKYARHFTCRLLGVSDDWAIDEVVEPRLGDVYFGIDLQAESLFKRTNFLRDLRGNGLAVYLYSSDCNHFHLLRDKNHMHKSNVQILEILSYIDGLVFSSVCTLGDIKKRFEIVDAEIEQRLDAKIIRIDKNQFESISSSLPKHVNALIEFLT
jgi:glycosyltransferase involved in cell wall biosynthesis